MPLTLDEILASITEYVGDDKTKVQEVARALHKSDGTQPVAQVLINRGSGRKIADAQGKIAEMENRITDLTDALAERDAELDTLKSAAPDWKKKLDAQEAKAAERLQKIQGELDTERKARREDKLSVHRQRAHAKLQPGILVDADYADVLMSKYGSSLRLTEDGKLEVTEPGNDNVYDAADGHDPVDLWVADVLRGVPAKFKLAGNPLPGSGVQGGATGDLKPRTLEQVIEVQRKSGIYAM